MFGRQNYSNYPWNTTAQAQQGANTGILWVQGEAGAKSFLVAPGQSVLLMDSESNSFFIKSSDASGMPLPLRIFDYVERVAEKKEAASSDFITRDEFEKRLAEISRDAKQPVQPSKQQQKQQYKQHD